MSRIDDSNAERKAQEARANDKRNKERLVKERTSESTAFDRALAQKHTEAKREVKEPVESPPTEHVDDGEQLHATDALPKDAQKKAADAKGAKPKTFGEKLEDKAKPPPRNQQVSSGIPMARAEARDGAIVKDARASAEKSDPKNPDAKTEDINASVSGGSASAKKQGPVQRAGDGEKGSGEKEQGKDQKSTSFKMPMAALMAPPPLARPKDTGQQARLSAMTKEIVEKIVSRVLVGQNEKGIPEFRIELKSTALKGLSIKVSGGRGGKIRAVFSGSDREVLKALRQTKDDLAAALTSRGLSLDEIVFEDT